MSIEALHITKRFGSFTALEDVNLRVNQGELVALLGPSGSGKTTLLRIIAGLEQQDAGEVRVDGEDASDKSARERRVGFVFQHYALFRHMTVFENAAFGLRVMPRCKRPSRAEIRDRVMELLKLVQVDWLSNSFPNQLSGGQRQRVALARALVIRPRILLLDEPFGALDARVRRELRRWLRRLHDEIRVTSVFVTHDQEEALEVSDRVVVMDHARIVQEGTPEDVYDRPASPLVFEFLGNVNLFHGRVRDRHVNIQGVAVPVAEGAQDADQARAYVRPQDFDVTLSAVNGSSFEAVVEHVSMLGSLVRLELLCPGRAEFVEVELSREQFASLDVRRGSRVWLKPRQIAVFPMPHEGHRP
ncbi:sulfate/molybdate ABC transporter ATP-binding protein [Candidatus Poribacteria bacterium]|nr:sulfate/molybdate ABC transporter ATP-binding protein [Candidatus Poribacteria bacterium]